MADTVSSQTITDVSGSKTVIKFTNLSDGTGESLVKKVDAKTKSKTGLNELLRNLD